jgi:hypothetical protein
LVGTERKGNHIKIRLQLIEIERKIVQKGMWHTHGKMKETKIENIMGEQCSIITAQQNICMSVYVCNEGK